MRSRLRVRISGRQGKRGIWWCVLGKDLEPGRVADSCRKKQERLRA